ncbi:MAG: hypothetical protein EBR05_11950 [Marivivens sp.]|nr:hypothetical protein [Marivivens sp.]
MGSMIEKHSNAKMQVWQRGFKYTLTNGYTLSCAFGWGNYCDNQHDMDAQIDAPKTSQITCNDFEVAVFEPNGDMVDLFPAEEEGDWSDQVIGFVPASAMPRLILALMFWPVRGDFMDGETFKGKLHARCRMFRKICKDFIDQAEKETENA